MKSRIPEAFAPKSRIWSQNQEYMFVLDEYIFDYRHVIITYSKSTWTPTKFFFYKYRNNLANSQLLKKRIDNNKQPHASAYFLSIHFSKKQKHATLLRVVVGGFQEEIDVISALDICTSANSPPI